jgi:putative AdoMet-dependent methyltransferase
MTKWIYDESKHCGVDYSDEKQAGAYDSQHQQFRNFEKEFNDMLHFLSLSNTQELSIIDFGCGTGASTIYAAKKFKKVFAIDISDAMISKVKAKAVAEDIENIEFHLGGFLSYKHNYHTADIIITKHAFHHLPDFWKQIALFRMNKILAINGILYLCDVTFNLDSNDYKAKIDNWLEGFEEMAGKKMRAEAETHIREEFSTFNWILEGMFARAGFLIEKNRSSDGFITEYFCRKVSEIEYKEE